MAVNQEYALLDGIAPSWADFNFTISPTGAPLLETRDIKSIKCSRIVEVGEQRGASGGRVIMRTTGQVKYEMSMVLYYTGYIKFLDSLAAAAAEQRGNQNILSLVHWGGHLLWTPPGSVEIYERRVKGCRYLGDSLEAQEGVDAHTFDVTVSPLEIVDMRNGKECVLL